MTQPTNDADIERERKVAADIAAILRALASDDDDRRCVAEEELAGLIEIEEEAEQC